MFITVHWGLQAKCGLWPAQVKVPEAGLCLSLPPSALCPYPDLDRKGLYMVSESQVLAVSGILVRTARLPSTVTQPTSMLAVCCADARTGPSGVKEDKEDSMPIFLVFFQAGVLFGM